MSFYNMEVDVSSDSGIVPEVNLSETGGSDVELTSQSSSSTRVRAMPMGVRRTNAGGVVQLPPIVSRPPPSRTPQANQKRNSSQRNSGGTRHRRRSSRRDDDDDDDEAAEDEEEYVPPKRSQNNSNSNGRPSSRRQAADNGYAPPAEYTQPPQQTYQPPQQTYQPAPPPPPVNYVNSGNQAESPSTLEGTGRKASFSSLRGGRSGSIQFQDIPVVEESFDDYGQQQPAPAPLPQPATTAAVYGGYGNTSSYNGMGAGGTSGYGVGDFYNGMGGGGGSMYGAPVAPSAFRRDGNGQNSNSLYGDFTAPSAGNQDFMYGQGDNGAPAETYDEEAEYDESEESSTITESTETSSSSGRHGPGPLQRPGGRGYQPHPPQQPRGRNGPAPRLPRAMEVDEYDDDDSVSRGGRRGGGALSRKNSTSSNGRRASMRKSSQPEPPSRRPGSSRQRAGLAWLRGGGRGQVDEDDEYEEDDGELERTSSDLSSTSRQSGRKSNIISHKAKEKKRSTIPGKIQDVRQRNLMRLRQSMKAEPNSFDDDYNDDDISDRGLHLPYQAPGQHETEEEREARLEKERKKRLKMEKREKEMEKRVGPVNRPRSLNRR